MTTITIANLVPRVREWLEDTGPETTTTTTGTGTSIAVADPTIFAKGQVIENYSTQELMLVTAADGATSPITVRRPYRDSTLTSCTSGDVIRVNPRFPSYRITEALTRLVTNGLNWPYAWKKSSTTITPSTSATWYDLGDAGARTLISVSQLSTTTEFYLANGVDFSNRPFKVFTDSGQYLADTVIISTGASPNHLEIPGESELTGKGVSYCATCDGWFFKDKKVVVVGGGDSALEEGLFLTRYAREVHIVHRREELRAGAILQKRAMENEKIHFVWNTIVTEVVGNEKVEAVKMKNLVNGDETLFETDGVFIFIGHTPNTQIFEGQLELDPLGYIVVNSLMETSVPGVFACGEAADPHFRQVITSAGMGAAAAIQATRYLEAQEA